MTVSSVYQEDVAGLNTYAPNIRTSKYTKQKQNCE